MEIESTQLFNDRLAQWVAKQGFWFQLRYSLAGGGASVIAYHLLQMTIRVAIFFAVVGLICLAYLIKRPEQLSFKTKLSNRIVAGLDCDLGSMRGFTNTQNKATIRHLALSGGEGSFFHTLEAGGITFRMGLIDSLKSVWNANAIVVDRLSVNIKAGAESPEEATRLGKALVDPHSGVAFQTLESTNARVTWGYSSKTMGSISQSNMLVLRENNGWRVTFKKGVFQQNWLRNLEIDELILICNDQGIVVEKGEFHVGNAKDVTEAHPMGKVKFSNVRIDGGARPTFSGNIELENISLDDILQDTFFSYIEGSVSGTLKISGSTNSPDGIGLAGRISLNENDQITIRSRIHLLNSLSILSPSGSYQKVTFTEGYFTMKTGAGKFQVDDINLTAPNQMVMKGNAIVRPPTQQEIDELLRKGTITSDMATELGNVGAVDNALTTKASDELTLKNAAAIVNKDPKTKSQKGFIDDDIDLGVPFRAESVEQEIQMRAAEKIASVAVYEGALQLQMPIIAFPEDSPLRDYLAKTPNQESLILNCPLKGSLFELTLSQAEDLLLLKKAEAEDKNLKKAPVATDAKNP